MAKSRGIGRGGCRPGGGRPKGSTDKQPRKRRTILELLPKLVEPDRQLPLYRLLDRINDATLDPKYRDMLAIAVLPYLHPRAFTRLTVKPFFVMTGQELVEVQRAELEHERQVELGRGRLRLVGGPE